MATNAYYLNQFISTTLSTAGGIDDSQTTGIKIASTSGVTTDKPGILCLSYSDPIDTTKAEWISYTSIDVFNELQGVTRGEDGFSAKAHSNGVTVAFPISRSHINNLNDALIIDDTETNLLEGILDEDDMASNSATKGVTQQSAKAYVDNGTWLKDSMSRQAIINGNFDVWQRGTSVALSDTSTQFLADRWADTTVDDGGTLPTLTRSRQTFTAGELFNSFYFTRLVSNGTGTSLGNSSYHRLQQKIEYGTRLLCGNGKKVTVSFWARSDIANKRLGVTLYQRYGTGGTPSAVEKILSTPITLTSTLTKYTATFTTNTLSGKTFGTDNNDSLDIIFYDQWGTTVGNTDVQASVSAETYGNGYIDIAQVQLCAGDVALPFMPKSYEEELRACQRYCQLFNATTMNGIIGFGYSTNTTRSRIQLYFKTPMRTTPTLSATATDWKVGIIGSQSDVTSIEILDTYQSDSLVSLTVDTASGLTANNPSALMADGTANRKLYLLAEL